MEKPFLGKFLKERDHQNLIWSHLWNIFSGWHFFLNRLQLYISIIQVYIQISLEALQPLLSFVTCCLSPLGAR